MILVYVSRKELVNRLQPVIKTARYERSIQMLQLEAEDETLVRQQLILAGVEEEHIR